MVNPVPTPPPAKPYRPQSHCMRTIRGPTALPFRRFKLRHDRGRKTCRSMSDASIGNPIHWTDHVLQLLAILGVADTPEPTRHRWVGWHRVGRQPQPFGLRRIGNDPALTRRSEESPPVRRTHKAAESKLIETRAPISQPIRKWPYRQGRVTPCLNLLHPRRKPIQLGPTDDFEHPTAFLAILCALGECHIGENRLERGARLGDVDT